MAGIEGHRWAEWGRNRDKPITQNALARLLKKFTTEDGLAIAPGTIRIGTQTPKGYLLDQFTDAFVRYLGGTPGFQPQHRNTPTATGTSATFQTATCDPDVAVEKCEKPPPNGPCCGVAVEKGGLKENAKGAPIDKTGEPEAFPLVCEHCGAPEHPGNPCLEVADGDDGRSHWIHTGCVNDWIDAADTGIPPFLRRQ